MRTNMRIRRKNGVVEKQCGKCGKWKLLDEFYTRKSYRLNAKPGDRLPRSSCIACDSRDNGVRYRPDLDNHGIVPITKIKVYLNECIRRLGQAEVSRRTGITEDNIWKYTSGRTKRVYRRTALKIFHLMQELQETGEVRTKREILHGTHIRRKNST